MLYQLTWEYLSEEGWIEDRAKGGQVTIGDLQALHNGVRDSNPGYAQRITLTVVPPIPTQRPVWV